LEALAQGPQGALLMTDRPLSEDERLQLGVVEMAEFTDAIAYEYPYYIYRRMAPRRDGSMQPMDDRKR
jgi:hypothetical protein